MRRKAPSGAGQIFGCASQIFGCPSRSAHKLASASHGGRRHGARNPVAAPRSEEAERLCRLRSPSLPRLVQRRQLPCLQLRGLCGLHG